MDQVLKVLGQEPYLKSSGTKKLFNTVVFIMQKHPFFGHPHFGTFEECSPSLLTIITLGNKHAMHDALQVINSFQYHLPS
jgi:hypothetical protein